jgi:hypothetical protein
VRELEAQGRSPKATEQPIDTSSAAGRPFLQMLGVFADPPRAPVGAQPPRRQASIRTVQPQSSPTPLRRSRLRGSAPPRVRSGSRARDAAVRSRNAGERLIEAPIRVPSHDDWRSRLACRVGATSAISARSGESSRSAVRIASLPQRLTAQRQIARAARDPNGRSRICSSPSFPFHLLHAPSWHRTISAQEEIGVGGAAQLRAPHPRSQPAVNVGSGGR